MPLYEYRCETCSSKFEVIGRVGDTEPVRCPECGEPAAKLLSGFAIGGLSGAGTASSKGSGGCWSGG